MVGAHGEGGGLGLGEDVAGEIDGDFDPEWGDHIEAGAGDWDVNVSAESAYANAKPIPEPFIPKDVIEEPVRTNHITVPSTEKALKGLEEIYKGGMDPQMMYWDHLKDFVGDQLKKVGNELSWSDSGMPYGIPSLRNSGGRLKGTIQKFNNNLENAHNKSKAKYKRTNGIVNGFKNKLKELTKTDPFNFNYNGGGGGGGGGGGNSGGSGGGHGGSSNRGGGGGGNDYEEGGNMPPEMEKKLKHYVQDTTENGSGQGGSGGNDPKEKFQQYFTNRFKSHGNTNFGYTTDNIKGRQSGVCNGGTKPDNFGQLSASLPSKTLAENVSIIKNKSYFDFDLNIDVLFREKTKAGISFRMRDQYNYYSFFIDTQARTKSILKVIDGKTIPLKVIEDGGVILNDWHSIHITLTNSNIKVFIYDSETVDRQSSEKVIEAYDNSFVEGSVGIITSQQSGFCFDKLKIQGKTVWTPWVPKNGIYIETYTSSSFEEGKNFILFFFRF